MWEEIGETFRIFKGRKREPRSLYPAKLTFKYKSISIICYQNERTQRTLFTWILPEESTGEWMMPPKWLTMTGGQVVNIEYLITCRFKNKWRFVLVREIEPTNLACQGDILTNWATRPGLTSHSNLNREHLL